MREACAVISPINYGGGLPTVNLTAGVAYLITDETA